MSIWQYAISEFNYRKNNLYGIFKEVKLLDTKTKEVFYDKLTYIYVELANFNKSLEECSTLLDKWLYCLRNLSRLLERPAALQGRVFEKLFRTAEITKFDATELRVYEQSVNAYRDIKNGMDAAKEEGRVEGRKEGRAEGMAEGQHKEKIANAKSMKALGLSVDMIQKITGLSVDEIDKL